MLPDKQMGMYGIYAIYSIIYNIWAHLPLALHSVAVAVDKLNFCAALLPCVNLPFGFATFSLFRVCTVRMLQVVTFNLIKSQLRKSKINALLFNSNKQRNFCCLHWQSQSVAKRSVVRVSRRYDLQLRHKATAADRQRKWNRERDREGVGDRPSVRA